MAEVEPTAVRRAAMDLLARREHSRFELLTKLTRRFGDNPDIYAEEIDKLADQGLQSDLRLAEAFVRAKINRGQGPVKIRSALYAKQVADEFISIAFEQADVDWPELAQTVARKKFGDDVFQVSDMKTKARVSRFLQQRGFSFDHISSLY